jgi:hypothetical protein
MKRVFLSFAYEDVQAVKGLIPLISDPNYDLDFYEGSLDFDFDSNEAEGIKRAIGDKISKCNVTVCLIGQNTYKDKWVECELKKSRNKGNKSIAMALKKIDCAVLPDVVREENLTFYPWNPRKLKELLGDKNYECDKI